MQEPPTKPAAPSFPFKVGLLCGALSACSPGPNIPSDSDVIATFQRCRPQYEAAREAVLKTPGLVKVQLSDAGRLTYDPAAPATERTSSIQAIFTCANLRSIRAAPGVVSFDNHASGLALAGVLKGIEYTKLQPDKLIGDTDAELEAGRRQQRYAFGDRRLDQNWYIYLSAN